MFKTILRVASGNFLEMYDFMAFAYFAPEIARAYFPSESHFASLMMTLATFGAGYLMRPLGALVLGSYIDHHGRRAGLLLTLSLMSVGTLVVAVTPAASTIGLVAPIVVLIGRLIQGFSAGAELGGVSVYLAEIAPPNRKGFYVAWQSASQQVAVMAASLIGVVMSRTLAPEAVAAWGWRVPLLIGCAILPYLFWLRGSLTETPEFLARPTKPQKVRELVLSVFKNWTLVLTGVGLSVMSNVSFYFVTAYTPTFGREALHLTAMQSLTTALLVGANNFLWLPISGAVSDRFGRRSILIACSLACVLTAYPTLAWLAAGPSYARLVTAELWLSFLYAFYNGTMVCYLTEVMPTSIRTTAFSLAYSLAVCAGGFTAFISTGLIQWTGQIAAPGWWLAFAAFAGLLAVLIGHRPKVTPLPRLATTD